MSLFRRTVITLSFASCALLGVLAKDASAQIAGLKAGMQWSTFRVDGATDPDVTRRPGFLGGLFWQFGQRTLMGQLEGLVSRTSVSRNGYDTDITSFEIPLLVRVNFVHMEKGEVFLSGGGAFASRWRARNVIDGNKIDIKDEIEPWDIQWLVGGGVEIRRVLIDARYTRGMRNINATSDTPKVTTDRFGVSVGYGF